MILEIDVLESTLFLELQISNILFLNFKWNENSI